MMIATSRIRFWRSVVVVLTGLAVGLPLLGYHPWMGLEISPATTVVTSPLDASGFPDYAEFLNARHRPGVTPENNAAVVLLGHLTSKEIDQIIQEDLLVRKISLPWNEVAGLREQFRRELGLSDPSMMPALVELSEMGSRSPEYTPEVIAAARSFLCEIRKTLPEQNQPLPEEAWQLIAQWVQENEELLQRIGSKSHRQRYYYPLVSLGRDGAFADIGLRCLNHDKNVSRLLRGHAELRLRAGDLPGAAADARTLLRYAQLSCQSASPAGIPAARIWANNALVVIEKLSQIPGGAELVISDLFSPMAEYQREFVASVSRNYLPGMQASALSFTLLLWTHGEIKDAETKRYPQGVSVNRYLREVNSLFEEARPVFESGDVQAIREWVQEATARDKPTPNRLEDWANLALKPFGRNIIPSYTPQMIRQGVLNVWSNHLCNLESFERMERWLPRMAAERSMQEPASR